MKAGDRFGSFRVLAPLGRGGMAETFVGLREGPGRFEQRVCLKAMHARHGESASFRRQFVEEARVAGLLRHRNIVQLIDFGETSDSFYLALELIDGMDLRGIVRHGFGPLAPEQVVSVARGVAAALAYAHKGSNERPVVLHRDVSPANVLISVAGEVKLADFGIARAADRTRFTRTGMVKGKVAYMAPEYVLGEEATPGTDLFALGVTLFEALTGVRPFGNRGELEVIAAARTGAHPPLRTLCPGVPSLLTDAIEGLIRPNPKDRPQSAEAFLAMLAALPRGSSGQRGLQERVIRERISLREAIGDASTLAVRVGGGTALLGAQNVAPAKRPVAAPADAETRSVEVVAGEPSKGAAEELSERLEDGETDKDSCQAVDVGDVALGEPEPGAPQGSRRTTPTLRPESVEQRWHGEVPPEQPTRGTGPALWRRLQRWLEDSR